MELLDLMKKISQNNIPHFLILFGEEQKILDIYIEHILSTTKGKRVCKDSVSSVMQSARKKSLDKSIKVYTVIDDADFLTADKKWDSVKQPLKKDYLILRYHSLDKRSSFMKHNKQYSVEFSHLSKDVLCQYINKDLPDLSEENALKLIGYCGSDYGRILMEIDKIWQTQSSRLSNFNINLDSNDCFEELDKQGLFHKEIGDITFELTDAVLGGYSEKAIQKLDEAKRKGEPAMRIVTILYRGFRNLLAYQGLGKNKKEAMERTGLTKGEIWGCNKNIGGYNLSELRRNMLLCQKVESGIKIGNIDEDIALDYLVLNCLK